MKKIIKKIIKNYPDYSVDEWGNVYSKKNKNKEIILKQRVNSGGYLYVNLCNNGKYKSKSIHKLVSDAFIENINNHPVINHIDGNKLNNNASNLEWCTLSHNSKEAFRLGLSIAKKGKDSNLGSRKLNLDIACKIRKTYEELRIALNPNKIYILLAKEYNVSKATIISIIKNKTYIY